MTLASFVFSSSPTPPLQQPAAHVAIPELVAGSVLALVGLRSLVRWLRVEFVASSLREQFLYSLHIAARVGLWFAFAGFFYGLALVDRPQHFTWYLLVPLAVAGVQLVTAVALGGGFAGAPAGSRSGVESAGQPPGRSEPEKRGETSDPSHSQPEP